MNLPKSLSHLNEFAEMAQHISGPVWGFTIPQFLDSDSMSVNPMWLKFRQHTIGSSEVALVMGLNEHGTLAQRYWEKLGYDFNNTMNEYSYWGHESEESIAKAWSYFSGEKDSYVHNRVAGKRIRQYRPTNQYLINENYPWLSASLDFIAEANQETPFRYKEVDKAVIPFEFPIECKTISGWVANQYEAGIPIQYMCQVYQQMLVFNCDYMEFVARKDGNSLEVLPFEISENTKGFVDQIINSTMVWWYEVVMPAKDLMSSKIDLLKTLEPHDSLVQEVEGKIQHLEPSPDTTKAYEEFKKAQYRESYGGIRMGTDGELEVAEEYAVILKKENDLSKRKQELKNNILNFMGDIEVIDFGDRGKITWRREEGKRPYFGVKIKDQWQE